jgi:protein phosphatase
VAAVVGKDCITFTGAGDSRLYRIRGESIKQLTTDDSWVQVAIDEGVLGPEEAEHHPMRNIITKAIGAKEDIDVPVFEEQLQEGDFYVLCSDGLHGMINDEEICRIVVQSGNELEKCVKELIEAANDNGGKDNVTVLVLRHRD